MDEKSIQEEALKQGRFALQPSIQEGEDDKGSYQLIPLSMILGGDTKPTKVYGGTRGLPKHLKIDSSPNPRGWYKDKHTPPGQRPRPCYSEALLTTPFTGYCLVGCKFCVSEGTKVSTPPTEEIEIWKLKVGDIVWSRTENGIEATRITGKAIHQTPNYYQAVFDNGRILQVTGDHPVFVEGKGWIRIDEVTMGERIEALQILRAANNPDERFLQPLVEEAKEISRLLQLSRINDGDLGWEGIDRIGDYQPHPSVARLRQLELIEEPIPVYDLQTESGNFYAEGILVHNCYVDFGSRGYHATGLPAVNERYPEFMAKQLSKMRIVAPAYMSSFTEVFQQLEDTYHVVRRLTEVLVRENVPIFYLSRKIPPSWAEEALLANPYSYMQWSVNSGSEEVYRKLSPGSFRLEELYRAVGKYRQLEVYTSFQINPILPGIVDLENIKTLVSDLAQAGANHVIFKFCESNLGSYRELVERLRSGRLQGVDEFESLMTQIIGGVRTIRQDYRIAWLKELLPHTRALGITMSLCYEYYDNGKAGANLAPWFTTSDQCHGPAAPIHFRAALGQPFRALPGCYRKGCLYCGERGTKACQNDTLLAAKALQYKDYRTVDLVGHELRLEDWKMKNSAPSPGLLLGPNRIVRGQNPGLKTDAELWGLPPLEEVL